MNDAAVKSDSDVLIRVDGVSKKFCRGLKRSLWYGVQDVAADLVGRCSASHELRRDEFWAVHDVSFELKRGECLGLIGHNGAGKTTLLKMLNGLVKPDRGRIEMRGRIGALIALGAGFNPILTGRENIYVNASILGLSKREIDAKLGEIIEFAEIGEFIDSPVQSYSAGMAVRLGFAVATAVEPDILLLDEVLAVGDVSFQARCFNILAEFRKRGTCFLLVSHNMHTVSRYSQRVLYLSHGNTKHIGECETGIAHYLSDMKNVTSYMESGVTDWSETYGSGKVKLVGAHFLNGSGNATDTIDVGDSVTIVIDYESYDPDINNPILDVMARDTEGIVYQGTSALAGQPLGQLQKNGKFHVRFETMPVNVCRLEFFFTLLESETTEVLDWKRNVRLNIRPSPVHVGKLVIPTTWTVVYH